MSYSNFPLSQEEHTARIAAAVKKQCDVNLQTVKVSQEVATEKVQYFEKIAFGSGATIAAVVSFVASNSKKLHTPNLLRWALVLLVFVMFGSMYRNWRFPFYKLGVWVRLDAQAKQQVEVCEYEYLNDSPQTPIIQDDKLISREVWSSDYLKRQAAISTDINNSIRKEDRTFTEVKYVEIATLLTAVIAMGMLVALVWLNFGTVNADASQRQPIPTHVSKTN
jgi:hypothetical protein